MTGKSIVGVTWGLAASMVPALIWLAADWRIGAGVGAVFGLYAVSSGN